MTNKEDAFWEIVTERTTPYLMMEGSKAPIEVFVDTPASSDAFDDALVLVRKATEQVWTMATRLLGPHGHGYPLVVQLRDQLVKRQEYLQARLNYYEYVAESAHTTAKSLEERATEVGREATLVQVVGASGSTGEAGAHFLPLLSTGFPPPNPQTGEIAPSSYRVREYEPIWSVIERLRRREGNARKLADSIRRSRVWARHRATLVDNVLWQFEAYGRVVSSEEVVGELVVRGEIPRATGRPRAISDEKLWERLRPLVEEAGKGDWWKGDRVVVSKLRRHLRKYLGSFFQKQKSDSRLDTRIREVLRAHGIRVLSRDGSPSEG